MKYLMILGLLFASYAAIATANKPSLSILGMTTGMTEGEAAVKMKALNYKKVEEHRYTFQGTDITFLADQLWRRPDNHGGSITFIYLRPPAKSRVALINRNMRGQSDSLEYSRLKAALESKYGKPEIAPGYLHEEDFSWGRNESERCVKTSFKANTYLGPNEHLAGCGGMHLTITVSTFDSAAGKAGAMTMAVLADYGRLFPNVMKDYPAYSRHIADALQKRELESQNVPQL